MYYSLKYVPSYYLGKENIKIFTKCVRKNYVCISKNFRNVYAFEFNRLDFWDSIFLAKKFRVRSLKYLLIYEIYVGVFDKNI